MSLADLCLILGMLFAFATLVVKIIEVARRRIGARAGLDLAAEPQTY